MPTSPDSALELYKLEYERCAIRYEDIYKAIWTNFSYLSVVSGAVLTLGGSYLNTNLSAFIACFPLLFWYWATFIPLDRYANQVLDRLKALETLLNEKYTIHLDHYTGFLRTKTEVSGEDKSQTRFRARSVIKAFLFLLHIIAIFLSHRLYGLQISLLLGILVYVAYICTHLEARKKSGTTRFAVKAISVLVLGAAMLKGLTLMPPPTRPQEVKKIVVTNKEGVINITSDGIDDHSFEIQLIGFEGLRLKQK